MNLGWKLHVRNGYAKKLLLSTFSSFPKLEVVGTETVLLQGPRNINFMHSSLHMRGWLSYPAREFVGISEKKWIWHKLKHLILVAGKAWDGLGNMICLQDCRSLHDLRPTNQWLLKVKCAEFMSGFAERERETHLLDPMFVKAWSGSAVKRKEISLHCVKEEILKVQNFFLS